MSESRKVQNLHSIAISKADVYSDSEETPLARKLISLLKTDPKPQPDEWGLSSVAESWVLFSAEGTEPQEVGSEAEPDTNQWINGFSLIRPSENFLQDFEQSLRADLKQLFEGSEFLPQRSELLFRISAS